MILTNMMLNSINKLNSGYIIIDTLCMIIIPSLLFYISSFSFKNKLFRKIESLMYYFDKTNCIIFTSSENSTSKRFKAIMHYISKKNDPSVKKLLEIIEKKYSSKTNNDEETKNNCYRVNQTNKFIIDNSINGRIIYQDKEVMSDITGKTKTEQIINLEVSSYLSLVELQDWVEKRLSEYELYVCAKISGSQLLVEVGWDNTDKNLDIYYNKWESNATFDNRFFKDKQKILDKINFFINNPDWYKTRGIPWTLGFLIWGNPGCGKTGFIKALMNLTKRNGITIKLNDKFDLQKLKEIIYDDEITDDLIIPQDKKILIFEDIDCMGELIKDRDLKEKEKLDKVNISKKQSKIDLSDYDSDSSDSEIIAKLKNKSKNNNCDKNNNLSYFLNILDGLHECSGRIIIMTTNKPHILDAALTREGRIDYKIEFTNATYTDVKDIVKFYWSNTITNKDMELNIHKLLPKIDKIYTHAKIVNICRSSETIESTIDIINGHIII